MSNIGPKNVKAEVRAIHELGNHLSFFFYLCEKGSISKAAALLQTSPKTVRNHIKLLNEIAEHPLVEPPEKPFQPAKITPFGRLIYNELKVEYLSKKSWLRHFPRASQLAETTYTDLISEYTADKDDPTEGK